MIATILPGSADFHAVGYNEHKVSKGLARLIKMRNFGTIGLAGKPTTEEQTGYLRKYSSANSRIRKPQFHVTVSCKGREMTESELLDFAHRYLKEMGYAEPGQPWLIYVHLGQERILLFTFSMIILRSCPHKDVGTALYILLTANWSRYNIFFLFIVYLCLCKINFSIFSLVYSIFSMVTILCEFVNPYQSPCAIAIRLQSEMTTDLERFIITYFSVPLTVKAIVIKSWFCDILIFLFFS